MSTYLDSAREELSSDVLRERNCKEIFWERGIVKRHFAREELSEREIAGGRNGKERFCKRGFAREELLREECR